MTDAEELSRWLARRRQPDADRAAIDAAVFRRFGRAQAVLFTDLVGFSRVVEAFGILHFLQLIEESQALFLPLISQHGGRCLKREGDSLLALFDTPPRALAAAQAMQQTTQAVNVGRRAEDRIGLCIGLGWGEVLLIGAHEVWGAEVNAASRLGEDRARGGEVLVSEAFRRAMPEVAFVEHGTLFGRQRVFMLPPQAAPGAGAGPHS